MKKILIAACTIACAVAVTVAKEPFNYLLGNADKAISEGNWAEAERNYRQLIDEYPDSRQIPYIMSNMALMQSNQGNDSLALQTLDAAFLMDSTNLSIIENRATILVNMGDNRRAMDDFARIVRSDSLNTFALFYHGSLALNSGDTITARSSFDRLRLLRPDDEATHKAFAAYYTKVRNYPAAIAEYNILIAKKPEVETYLSRAANNLMLDRLDDASQDIAEAMRMDSNDGEAYLLRAALNKKRYELDAAKADGKRAMQLGVSPRRVSALLGVLPD